MSEEINGILNQLEIVARKHTIKVTDTGNIETMPASIVDELRLNNYSAKILLNYITNLQKENENYKQRNEKAIEWCECVVNAKYTSDKLPNGKTTDMGYCLDLAKPLLNILQGGDE